MEPLNNLGLTVLTTPVERDELRVIGRERVKLKRTFNQPTWDANLKPNGFIRFWRVIGPLTHRNLNSDLSLQGLKDWGIIR